MNGKRVVQQQEKSASPAWRVLCKRELVDLWVGGRALIFLILFSILLGVMSFLLATNSEMSLIPPKEMVFLMVQVTIAVGLFIGLVIGADSFSGERERATLEGLLLTPTSRRQLVVGKFLAAVSPWPASLAIASPFIAVLSPDVEILTLALLWGTVLGSILVAAFTGLGMLVSVWSNSNKTSLFVSLAVYLLFLIPTQFPGTAQAGYMGQLIKKMNPLESGIHFLEKTVVNNRTLDEFWPWLLSPLMLFTLVLGLLFWYASPGLRLEGGKASMIGFSRSRIASWVIFACLLGFPISSTATTLQETGAEEEEIQEEEVQEEESQDPDAGLQISIDMEYQIVKTGDEFEFSTTVSYHGTAKKSSPMIVAMNIINLEGDGDPVDPEDWSPERTHYLEPLARGESASQTWTIHAILDGDYMIYMVLVPEPDGEDETSQPVASSGIHLTVSPFARLNPGGVLPLALGVPIGLTLGTTLIRWRRRRGIDFGEAD